MKEQADQLRKILHHMGIPKKPTPEGIKIPYENLADLCVEFALGECYSFFGSQENKTLSCWKTNLLFKLLQQGVSICVLEGGDSFRRDFIQMACLRVKIDPDLMLAGQSSEDDFQAFTLALKEIALLPMVWTTDKGIPPNLKGPIICVKNMTLDEWREDAELLWTQARERNIVLFLFVSVPHYVPLKFDSLYHPYKIILPENLSSYVGMVKMEQSTGFPLEQQRMQLELAIEKTESFKVDYLNFDLDPYTREINPSSHI